MKHEPAASRFVQPLLPLDYTKAAINEKLLQFIWQYQYFNKTELLTTSGESIQVVETGKLNKDQGPDFMDGKIKIGKTTLVGTIEIHINATDWNKHGHQNDSKYKNVILHVVFINDGRVDNNIPVLELQSRISSLLLDKYVAIMSSGSFIACSSSAISQVKSIVWTNWKERLLVERLTRKSAYILKLLNETNGHWEEAFWWMLARNFGMKVNADAFESMARSLTIKILSKHKNSIHQLEALLFGQVFLLDHEFTDEYPKLLKREYLFLKNKYGLTPGSIPLVFLRMRPGNFPTIRLAQLAALIQNSAHLFSKVLELNTVAEVQQLFNCTANDYWHYHYLFDQSSAYRVKNLGENMVNNIIINTVAIVLFACGLHHNNQTYKDKALQWMEEMPVEENNITGGFKELHIHASSAYDSQALIELKNEYCNRKRCLECSVGNSILKLSVPV
jgi:hypothetical protein